MLSRSTIACVSALLGSLLIQLSLGVLYAWSTFLPPLGSLYGITVTQGGLIFGFSVASFTLTMVGAGRLMDRIGARWVAAIGGVLFGGGFLLASFSGGAFLILFLGLGVLAGAGIGCGYVCPLATCIRWFPNHRGLITGYSMAGFGGGAVLLTEAASAMMNRGMDPLEVFRWAGVIYGATILLGATLLIGPPRQDDDEVHGPLTIRETVRESRYWALALAMFAGTVAGLMVIGNLKPIGLSLGIDAKAATLSVSLFAIGNFSGRLIWGFLHDKMGTRTVPVSLVFLSGSVLLFLLPQVPWLFCLLALCAGFGYGACFVVYAAEVASSYGAERVGSVYPIVFLAYGFSGILGPMVGGACFDFLGTFLPAVLLAGITILCGAFAHHVLMRRDLGGRERFPCVALGQEAV